MKDYFAQTISAEPPVGQWYVLLDQHYLDRTYDVYLLCDTEDGRRMACSGQWFHTVDEGAVPPVWLERASEQVLDDTGVLNGFQFVYKINEQLVRVEP